MNLMKLYNYSLNKHLNNCIKCSNLQSLYSFQGYSIKNTISCGIFLTSNNFKRSDLAQEKLSITYRPKYRSSIQNTLPINLYKNYGSKLTDHNQDDNYSRVWPAFGYTGGAFEYLYDCYNNCSNSGLKTNNSIEYPTGGLTDFFYGKDVRIIRSIQNFFRSSKNLGVPKINKIFDVVEDEKIRKDFTDNEGRENVIKISESGLVFVSINIKRQGPNLSLSLGTRDFPMNNSVYTVCNLWATLWEDDFNNFERTVYGPIFRSWTYDWHNFKASSSFNPLISVFGMGRVMINKIVNMRNNNKIVTRVGLVLP